MSVWAVSMVRDEIDIITTTVQYLLAGGVTGFIIADNGSVDGTKELLQRLARQHPDVYWDIHDDTEIGYYQSRKMTKLARMAFAFGADWVIPFDADEIWYSTRSNHSLVDLIQHQDADILSIPLYNYFPTQHDVKLILNPTARINYRDPRPAPLSKVIVHNDPGIVIAQGNHDATSNRPLRRGTSAIEIGHFPWRRFGQFERKVRNGYEAYRATDLPSDVGAHWRSYGEILETQGQEALRRVFYKWFYDPPKVLQRYPIAGANRGRPVREPQM
jgi:glycosyltransferase involved in cell wall biosynthesis